MTPSDMFRSCLYAASHGPGHRFGDGVAPMAPLSVGMMYVMLCGSQTQNIGMTDAVYQQVLAAARVHSPGVGIAPAIQRTMWKLIKGIMASVEDPGIHASIAPIGDKGRSLFPILQDIVRNEYLRYQATGVGGWDDYLAQAMSDVLVGQVGGWGVAQSAVVARTTPCDCSSPERLIDLSPALVASVGAWQWQLQERCFDFDTGRYVYGGPPADPSRVKGVLVISPAQARALAHAVSGETESAPLPAAAKALLAAGGLGAAYLGFRGYRVLRRRMA